MTRLRKYSDEALMDLIQKGSVGAFDELYLRYSQKLLATMYRMVGDKARAQDLLHDVFLLVIENPQKFDTTKNFKSWIYTVALNACRKSFRGPKVVDIQQLTHVEAGGRSAIEQLTNSGIKSAMESALNALSIEHKEVFVLHHQQGLSIKEIAQIVQCAEGTVKSRLFSCRKQLAQKLKLYKTDI